MRVAVLGAGAFGTALAVALAREGRAVTLWARAGTWALEAVRSSPRLPDVTLPPTVGVTADLARAAAAPILLAAVPMRALADVLLALQLPGRRAIVACCKGIDADTLDGPTAVIAAAQPGAVPAILTGPSFAADIARGLPTALTLACADARIGAVLQRELSTPVLRLYRTDDTTGAELGGALKNVIAIGAGIVTGAGLGESARAALLTRGHAEMLRLAAARGARAETLSGLSGLGDLVLTCTSEASRNFRHGRAIGAGLPPPPVDTVEGVATARAVAAIARRDAIDLPIASAVAAVLAGEVTVARAIDALLARPLKPETS